MHTPLHPDDPHFEADLEILYKAIQNLEPENASLPETTQKQSAAWYWVLKDRYGVLQGLLMPPTQETQEPQIHLWGTEEENPDAEKFLMEVYHPLESDHVLYSTNPDLESTRKPLVFGDSPYLNERRS